MSIVEMNSVRDMLLLQQKSVEIIMKLPMNWFSGKSPETHYSGQQNFLASKSGDVDISCQSFYRAYLLRRYSCIFGTKEFPKSVL